MTSTIFMLLVVIVILVVIIFIISTHYNKWITEEIEKHLKEKYEYEEKIKQLQEQKNELSDKYMKFLVSTEENELCNAHDIDMQETEIKELKEIETKLNARIKSLINEIDSFEKESINKEDSIKYKLDFENKFTRIIEPNNTFKLNNNTNSDLVVSVIKIVSDTKITDNKPYFLKLRKTNHIDKEHASSLDTCF